MSKEQRKKGLRFGYKEEDDLMMFDGSHEPKNGHEEENAGTDCQACEDGEVSEVGKSTGCHNYPYEE